MDTRPGRKTRHLWNSATRAASTPVDIAGLVAFRIAFGLLMVWEYWRYVQHDWIRLHYVVPEYYFSYLGFEWLKPWSADGMIIHFAALAVLGFAIAAGLFYRLSAMLFFLGFTYISLLDKANYLNHFYLISLISGLMIFVPAHRALSFDARWRPSIACQQVPAWTVWILRFQIAIPYIYGGFAKLNADWLTGEPMRTWLRPHSDFPLLGPYFSEDWMVLSLCYAGLLFDLLVVPALLWGKTRTPALVLAVVFHLMNARLFSIGIFPWLMIAATTLFLPTSWPRFGFVRPGLTDKAASSNVPLSGITRVACTSVLLVYLGTQILFPLRHWLYPGDASWTGEGDRFAWRMKLNERRGQVRFVVTAPQTDQLWVVDPRSYLTRRQYREMCQCPDMVLQFAKYLALDFHGQSHGNTKVYAHAWLSLNGRPDRRLIDPSVNLAAESLGVSPASWILKQHAGESQNLSHGPFGGLDFISARSITR